MSYMGHTMLSRKVNAEVDDSAIQAAAVDKVALRIEHQEALHEDPRRGGP